MRVKTVIFLIIIMFAAAGCAPGAGDLILPSPTAAEVTTMTPDQPQPTLQPIPEGTAALPQVEQAIDDLAGRLAIPADQIGVIDVQPMTWGDTSMGCPQPGMEYLQIPQDGLLVRLRAGDRVYDYHSGGNRDPFLCEQSPGVEKTTPVFGEDILTRPSKEGDQ